ncbi:hypothetical protein SAMN06295909_1427 [Plantibacter sp. VKM Ac-1784]|uniref:Uncharacterized protein n=1 Tax=Plantibacter elymi (nom. nud.) TaxID=199708 RepID=A0ABY1RB15_9MICO|nr:hypothetical protein [Plantibacter sp. VKM Ac-1784]SMQ67022.1 hypothetical protein SAMN06295909_1427 [Plantibacter sp. VKM Ac-1784]
MSDGQSKREHAGQPERDEVAPQGHIVSGGYRPTNQLPEELPPIADVRPGTIFQTADGSLWKASGGEILFPFAWLPALIVTPEQHRSATRTDWTLLFASTGIVFLGYVIAALLGQVLLGCLLVVPAGFLFWRWLRVRRTVLAHVVAPSAEDIT